MFAFDPSGFFQRHVISRELIAEHQPFCDSVKGGEGNAVLGGVLLEGISLERRIIVVGGMEEEFAAIHAANSWDLLYRVNYLLSTLMTS